MDWNTWQAWVRAGYGRLDPISWEAANVTLLDLVRPEVHHKVHHHWHSFPPPHPLLHPILGTLYTIIGLLSLTGNGIVLWVFSFTRSLRSGTNLLTINLAFSDLLMMLTQFPILVANCFNQSWMLGPFACEQNVSEDGPENAMTLTPLLHLQAVKYRNLHRREAQLSRVVLTSVFFWALAWTPYAVVSLLGVSSWYSLLTPMATALPALFAKLSTVYNPFIYAISHHKYRQELGRRLPWLCCILPSLSYQPSVSLQSSTRSDASSILHFFSRSSSVVSSRNAKAQSDLPSPKTLMSDMATMSFPKGFSRPMAL
ncbi:ceropsin-like [Scylla paramamosain]|uniref:ceropsin-like n=1 Tax=Scylla paramamosain TaxID=85552 RepID=UPI003082A415